MTQNQQTTETYSAVDSSSLSTGHQSSPGAPLDDAARFSISQLPSRTRLLILAAVCTLLATACWLEYRACRSTLSRLETQSRALTQMCTDAARIHRLSTAPKRAAERRRPNEELLTQIETALRRAGIPLDRWQDSLPQPAQQLANTSYKKLTTRLYFENVTLQDITTFAHHLTKRDPSLLISSIRLTAPRNSEQNDWQIDMAITYLICG